MQQTAWLVQRAVLAIVLMIGFYALVLTVVGVLLWIPYAEYALLHRVDIRIALGCGGLAIGLLVSLVPRRDRFTPPGPLLDEATEPRLFALVRDIAEATRQEMPSEIYLLEQVWAAQCRELGLSGPLLPPALAAAALPAPPEESRAAQDDATARRRRRSW